MKNTPMYLLAIAGSFCMLSPSYAHNKVVVVPLCGEKTVQECDCPSCDTNHLELCYTDPTCTEIGGYWYNDTCNDTKPSNTLVSEGRVWMDRNLGALELAENITHFEAKGDLYQWGRGTDGHEKRNSPTTSIRSDSDSPSHGEFIAGYASDWRTEPNHDLWQGESGINNPCPAGFRLPTATEWRTEVASWDVLTTTGAFASSLKLVPAGYRSGPGEHLTTDSNCFYWSSSVDGLIPYSFATSAINASVEARAGYGRISGFSVRCIQD